MYPKTPEHPEDASKEWFLGWVKWFVGMVDQKRYPIFAYRVFEPVVRRFDIGAADYLAKLQELRNREKALLNDLHHHLKTRLDGK